MDLDIVNRLFLELSQFATATTGKELAMSKALIKAESDLTKVIVAIEEAGASPKLTHAQCEAIAARDNLRDTLKRLQYI